MYKFEVMLNKTKISDKTEKFNTSKEVAENLFIQSLFQGANNDKERFYVIMFNNRNILIGFSLISMGSTTSTVVHPREVLKPAILSNAVSIITIHNHPSGGVEPSLDDISLTNRLKNACDIIGINLLDHIILGFDADEYNNYYSFHEHELL